MSALVLAGRVLAARLLIVAILALTAACSSTGVVNWTVTETVSPSPSCEPLVDAPGCVPAPSSSPASAPAPSPTGPDGKDYVPYCLPSDPPGSYCQAAP